MALDFALTSSALGNDIYFDETGNIVMIEGDELTAQRWRQTLETHTNEWAFDRTLGIDYLGQVLVKNPDLGVIRAMFIEATVGVPGIKEVTLISLDTDFENKRLLVTMQALSDDGTVLSLGGAEVDGDWFWTQL